MSKFHIQRKDKLLFIVNSLLIGGHEVQARHLVKDFVTSGADILVLCPDEDLCKYFIDTGALVRYVPFNVQGRIWKQVVTTRKVAKLISSYAAEHDEIIVSGGSIEAVINPIMAIKTLNSRAHVVAYVPMYIDRSLTYGLIGHLYNCVLNMIAKVCDEYLTVNRIQASIIKNRTGVATHYLNNRIRPVQRPKQTYGPRLVFAGRFDDKQKNITGLLSLLDHPDNPYQEIVLIGDGPDRELVLDAIKQIRHLKVKTLGWLCSAQMDDLIGTEDVLILNSRWEGEPLVVREFLDKGLVCVARDIAGVRGLVSRRFRFCNQSDLLFILLTTYHHSKTLG